MQTTLLGLAIAFILALLAALVGPYFIDWNQFRPQFEAEATRIVGTPVRVAGALDARLLPTPTLRLRSVAVANDLGKVQADKLDVEFSLGSLLRGEWRADELTVNGLAIDLGLDPSGRVDWPLAADRFNLGSLAIDRLNLTGRVALHDAASRSTLELSDIAFSGDLRALAGSVRGNGNFTWSGVRYPFRVSSNRASDNNGSRLHVTIDQGATAMAVDIDGAVTFEQRVPHFDGALTLAAPSSAKSNGGDAQPAWRLVAKVKADPATAHLDQLEASIGSDETAMKLTGQADIGFGASPKLNAALSARQLDADKLLAAQSDASEPVRLVPRLRDLITSIPAPAIATVVDVNAEQIMLGGRPLQNLTASLRSDGKSWTLDRLDFRAPGATHATLSGSIAQPGPSASFEGRLTAESNDPDSLAAWMFGRADGAYRTPKPIRVGGNVKLASNFISIEGLSADIEGGTIKGRATFLDRSAGGGSRLQAALSADSLNVDDAIAFAKPLTGPQFAWPDEAEVSVDIARAVVGGQAINPLVADVDYGPKSIKLANLQIGRAGGLTVHGEGAFDRTGATGKVSLTAAAPALSDITGLVAPIVPAVAARLESAARGAGAAGVKLTVSLDNPDHGAIATARAVLDVSSPQISGAATITATSSAAAVQRLDLTELASSTIAIESRMSSQQGTALLTLLGLDQTMSAGDSPAVFEGTGNGTWGGALQIKAKLSGADIDAEARGDVSPWASPPKAALDLAVRHANFAPLLGLQPSDALARNIGLTSRLTLGDGTLTFNDLDCSLAGSRIRGHLALTLGDPTHVDGEVGMDSLDLATGFSLAIGAAGHDESKPLHRGLLQRWQGQIAFQALRGLLPGGVELRPFSGIVKSDDRALTFQSMKGSLGGGEANADLNVNTAADGVALNARVRFLGVDGTALHYRALAMPASRASLDMTVTTQGRSASALIGALGGGGLMTLNSAEIAGLDPRAFDAAIRASDEGRAADDAKLQQIVEPALWAGALPVASAQILFTLRDGRLRVGATTLESNSARAIISGGYDIAADQADIRASLVSTAVGTATLRPEIQIFAVGTPDGLDRSVDITSLSSWLAVRTIDRETRRLDSIERGEAPLAPAVSAVVPAPAVAPLQVAKPPEMSAVTPSDLPSAEIPLPGPRRAPPRLKPAVPRQAILPRAPSATVVGQQAAPLPPPIEVRPAPGPARPVRPRLAPPLVLTPPASN